MNEASEYPEILAARERFKRISLGFKTRRFGKVAIVVDAYNDPARVLNSLAHELGHMRQDFLNPRQTEDEQSFSTDGIQEAQAQQFERVFWLALEEFTGLSLLKYPDYRAFGSLVDDRYNIWLTNADQEEHSLGYLPQWLTVLDDPALSDLRNEIAESGELSRSSSLRLYEYLVGLDPDTIQGYVAARINNLGAYLPTIISVSKQRLVSNLHPDDEGLSDLRVPSLMMP